MKELIAFLLWLSLLVMVARFFWILLRSLVIEPLMKPVILPLLWLLEPVLQAIRDSIESALSRTQRWFIK